MLAPLKLLRNVNTFKNIYFRNMSTNFKGLKGGQIVYQKLKDNNVDNVFLYSGGAIMPVVDAFYKGDIKYFVNTHEQSSGHAATGYAKASGKTGISIVTSGPALTNSITPLTDAMNDSTPLIVISGQVPLKSMGTNAFQECPSVELTSPITKWSYCVKDVHEIPDVMDKAFKIANEGKKGSVHIDLPKCVTTSTYINDELENNFRLKVYDDNIKLHPNYEYIHEIISSSKRPIILLGKGINNYSQEIRELVEKTKIPVTTTIHAMGSIDEMSTHSLQFLGMHGNAAANIAVQRADLILAIGTRFDDRITGNINKFAPNARKANAPGIIHVNISKDEHNFVLKTDHNYATDAGVFIRSLLPYIRKNNNVICRQKWLHEIKRLKTKYKFTYQKDRVQLKTQDIVSQLNVELQKLNERKENISINNSPYIVTTGVGNHQMMAAQFIKWRNPNTFITSGSLGVMGTGLPFAIGTQIAHPEKLVLNIDGDGSFLHTLAELKTIQDYNLPIKIAIMNDGEMSMVRVWEKLFFDGRHTATHLGNNVDYKLLAESFGIKGMRCTSHEELQEKTNEFINYKGPILCDFKVKSDLCLPLVSPGSALDDMILHSEIEFDSSNALPPG